jgi:hypothetical protein
MTERCHRKVTRNRETGNFYTYTMKKQLSLDIKWHYSTLFTASKLLHSYS